MAGAVQAHLEALCLGHIRPVKIQSPPPIDRREPMIELKRVDPKFREICSLCKGEGWLRRHKPTPVSPVFLKEKEIDMSATVPIDVEEVLCNKCDGSGRIIIEPKDRIDLYQEGKLVGSCKGPRPRFQTHFLVDERPGDFKPRLSNSAVVYDIARTLGPGDIKLIVGYFAEGVS